MKEPRAYPNNHPIENTDKPTAIYSPSNSSLANVLPIISIGQRRPVVNLIASAQYKFVYMPNIKLNKAGNIVPIKIPGFLPYLSISHPHNGAPRPLPTM